jgi:hypothetical protein
MVRDSSGAFLQVGRTCLRDYCGIDPEAALAAFNLDAIAAGLDVSDGIDAERLPGLPIMWPTVDALALACGVYRAQGYRRVNDQGSNRAAVLEALNKRETPATDDAAGAAEIAQYCAGLDDAAAIACGLGNVRSLLAGRYCKVAHVGMIAAAPLLYQRAREREAREAARAAELADAAATSDYIGDVGQRLTVDLSALELLTSWETDYGFTYLYKMRDVRGNVLVWFASRPLADTSARRIKCTIKAHDTRDGVRQTIVTRCAVA